MMITEVSVSGIKSCDARVRDATVLVVRLGR